MKISEVIKILDCKVFTGEKDLDREVELGCGCDLMSDVLAFIKPGSILLTGLINPQVIRTVEIAEIFAVCFVRGKEPTEEIVNMAKDRDIILLSTTLPMFEACGRLYYVGMMGGYEVSR
ncbi:MAG: hypothetical protein FJY65_07185 [Calditrichaeota bacterium]|nr:hypothetical protein [Calditrichota bacterium]